MATTMEFFDGTNVDGGVVFGEDLRVATVREYERVLADEQSEARRQRMAELSQAQNMREFFERVWESGSFGFAD